MNLNLLVAAITDLPAYTIHRFVDSASILRYYGALYLVDRNKLNHDFVWCFSLPGGIACKFVWVVPGAIKKVEDICELTVRGTMYSAFVCTPHNISCRMKVIAGNRKMMRIIYKLFGKMRKSNC